MKMNAGFIVVLTVLGVVLFSGCVKEEAGVAKKACMDSGGTVRQSMCCKTAGDFPNQCLLGACGCSPDNSHEVKICDCGENKCFNGSACVPVDVSGAVECISSSGESMSLREAKEIALAGECGDRLKDTHTCNSGTGTWWIDLDREKEGCNPACVVDIKAKTAEINWRCLGALLLPQGYLMSVHDLLEDPLYNTEVRIYGTVGSLGELDCPCFKLTSGSGTVDVWYDGTEKPPVSVGGIKNGDYLVVSGELKPTPGRTFWATSIDKREGDLRERSGEQVVGGDRDEHGCIGSAGYVWCESKQKCIRPWEEECNTSASTYCTEQGGTVVTAPSHTDYCLFTDSGSYCGLQDFFNKTCDIGDKHYTCDAIGSRSEGYYDSDTGDLIAWANCG